MIKVGIIGFGKIGRIRAEEIRKSHHAELIAVSDLNKPKDLNEGIFFTESFDELINFNLDAIFICTYNNVLANYTALALEAGLHVFCEKPPAKTTEELAPLKGLAERSGLVLKYGFNHRYHYSVMEARKTIHSGSLGRILWMRGVYGKAGSIDYHKNWRNFKNYSGGGILMDQGIHMLDLMRYFLGHEFVKVNSVVTTSYWDIEAEDNAFAILQSKDDIVASIHSSATQWRHKFLLEICCEEGYINLDGILSGTRSYSPEKLVVGRREFEDITHAMGKPKEQITWFENDDSWKLEIDEFLLAIKGLGKVEHGTFEDAYQTLSLVEKIYENVRN